MKRPKKLHGSDHSDGSEGTMVVLPDGSFPFINSLSSMAYTLSVLCVLTCVASFCIELME